MHEIASRSMKCRILLTCLKKLLFLNAIVTQELDGYVTGDIWLYQSLLKADSQDLSNRVFRAPRMLVLQCPEEVGPLTYWRPTINASVPLPSWPLRFSSQLLLCHDSRPRV